MNDKFLLTLLEKFDAASAAELDFTDGTSRLVLRKAEAFARPAAAGNGVPAGAANTAGAAGAGAADVPVHLGLPGNAGGSGAEGETITSPIVATFYTAPGPDAPPFVRPGSKVKAGDSLCILEAMKMMNHLEAEFDCEILAVKASSGDLVEYGQVLFEVKRLRG
ncbi:MAG: acetyl-CoA carboxylase biotin carboxyl carrier protein [Treponema sp.]|jgi:acetyl-CoA carboxylase biotin carboxyl carrier protein|nr:acetyl-CoA carboxylase biotin carboxyl carrier protein [Treponema sp.]